MSSGSPFNEAGEPIMSGEAWRTEQALDEQQAAEARDEDWWEAEARGEHEPWEEEDDGLPTEEEIDEQDQHDYRKKMGLLDDGSEDPDDDSPDRGWTPCGSCGGLMPPGVTTASHDCPEENE